MLQQYLCQYICRSDWQGRCILLKHDLWSKSLCAQTMEEPVLKQHKQFCCFASALYYPDFHRLCLIDSNEFTTYSCFCKSSCSFLTSMLMYVLQLCQLYVLFSSINTKQRNILPFFLVYYDGWKSSFLCPSLSLQASSSSLGTAWNLAGSSISFPIKTDDK